MSFIFLHKNEWAFIQIGLGEKFVTYSIKSAAVLGSGVMGSGIAAHLANNGIPVTMLDVVPKDLTDEEKTKGLTLEDQIVRNRIAEQSKKKLLKQKPSPITTKRV